METASLKSVMVHRVGSKSNLEPLGISKRPLQLSKELLDILQESFLLKFRSNPEQYAFAHTTSLDYNEVYSFCKKLFADAEQLENISAEMARHLYEASTHPKVKGGELYVAYFEGLPLESRMYKAVGLFKTENKSTFFDVEQQAGEFALRMQEGTELTRIDKGCLILNIDEDAGYQVTIFDNQSRGEEAQYWKEKFLGVIPQKNEYHHTNHFLTLTKQFITQQLDTEVDKTEQVKLLNRSIDYFKGNEAFDIEEFQNEVFESTEIIGAFREFGSRYTQANDFDIASSFDISVDAVKKQSKIFKSVLKLDKNFHIYIHGRTDLMEKGVDTDGRKFYKIYYQDES
jgi:hypothetical protein